MQRSFGHWSSDDCGLPLFVLTTQDDTSGSSPFTHLIATGKFSALLDRFGKVRFFTTDVTDGIKWFCPPNSSAISFAVSSHNGVEWKNGEIFDGIKTIRYGVGMAEYKLDAPSWVLTLTITAAPDATQYMDIAYRLKSKNGSKIEFICNLLDDSLYARHGASNNCCDGIVRIGYCCEPPVIEIGESQKTGTKWAKLLAPIKLDAPEEWMTRECVWSMGQLLSFRNYDGLLNEYYMNLGGYGWGFFAGRECSEVGLVLAEWYPEFAKENLRWVAKSQYATGRMPRIWDFTTDLDVDREPHFNKGIIEPRPHDCKKLWASDQEIWFVLGCMKFVELHGTDFLEEEVPFWAGELQSIYEHCRRAFYWVRDVIGRGEHGLIRMWHGDWNDYLDKVGMAGKGESVMNSGMACLAFENLANIASRNNDSVLAGEAMQFVAELRTALSACFTGTHFLRGYTDSGSPVGEDSVFLNAQTWAVLGGCCTDTQRQEALFTALRECDDTIGLCLMSKPYLQSDAPIVTSSNYNPGDGENAGIWPQTVYWFIWALCEAGLKKEAMTVWKKMSLHNHSILFPDVPFGIFNGPDCYSSHHSISSHGATQSEPTMNRAGTVPMNPIVAWQTWAMNKTLK